MTYLTKAQIDKLLEPIKPTRVSKDGKGFSHVEAYDIRATMNRLFGFARWSEEVVDLTEVFTSSEERKNKKGETYTAWTVCFRATVRLTVCAPDGTVLAVYTEAAAGDAQNYPSRPDAVDMAIKTAESQALKRAAANLGDVAGLSLYAKGSLAPLVRMTLHYPFERAEPGDGAVLDVDGHITEPLPPENVDPDTGEVHYYPRQVPVSELDRQRNPDNPEAERAARLAEQRVRRDALGVDSKGHTRGGPVAERLTGPDPEDPWLTPDGAA